MRKLTLIPVALAAGLAGTAHAGQGAPSLGQILSMHSTPSQVAANTSATTHMRYNAVFQAAQTYAAQSAYCHRTQSIDSWLNRNAKMLSKAYDFASLLLDGGRVAPPVIQQSESSFRKKSDTVPVTTKTTWHILKPAQIVSTAPILQNYLYLTCAPPLKPNPVLLPGCVASGGSSSKSNVKQSKINGAQTGVSSVSLDTPGMDKGGSVGLENGH